MGELEPVIRVEDAVVCYANAGAGAILRGVDLTVYRGEVVYLIGRVGSGKSSLLRTLYGDIPFHGRVGRVCGVNLAGLRSTGIPVLRRRVGIVFQEHNLITEYTVYQNLEFVLLATGWEPGRIHERIAQVLDLVNLSDKAHCLPMQISGGQRQRACVARALLNSPKLIIADEPMGNLDPDSADEIMSLLNGLAADGRCGVILSTHNVEYVRRFPNRTLLCEGGVVREVEL